MQLDAALNRRSFIAAAGAAVAAASALGCGEAAQTPGLTGESADDGHQGGIASRPQAHLQLAAFDLQRDSTLDLRELLRRWSALGAELAVSERTITFGLGPALFVERGRDRLGLARARPRALAPLPAFAGDALEPAHGGGDLCVQACADDPQAAYDALDALTRAAGGIATPRWIQTGFLRASAGTPRNLMGFKDGTGSIDPGDNRALAEHVWVGAADEPAWMRGGSYMVVRRIRMLLDVWDATSVREQEAAIGRRKATGAPLGARAEHDPVDLDAAGADGAPLIAPDAHVRLASARANGGVRILRRGYNYAGDVDAATGQRDAGLIFISYQRDPGQFIALQRRLAGRDALGKHLLHTGSAIFACPPAAQRGGHVGQALFA